MTHPHFKALGLNSFFGDMVYARIVPRDHFLVKLNQIVDWEAFVAEFLSAYQGLAVQGRPPYSPVVLLKMLIIAYLYNLSERQAEEVVNFQLPVKEFVGLAVDEAAPDHSTLSLFKRRLGEAGRWKYFEVVCDAVVRHAVKSGITLGQIQVVDSVHTVAAVDNDADRRRQDQGNPPHDPDATVVHKGKRTVTEPDGHLATKDIQYRGYKAHCSLNAATGLLTSVVPTSGRAADNLQFPALLAHDEALGVAADTYTGDMAYDDTDLHFRLEQAGKHSALRLHAYRTQKKDGNTQVWHALRATPEYEEGLKERYKIERKFGEGKLWHRLGRCRYLGLVRYGIQAYLTVLVMNLKRIVLLLTGVTFRSPVRKVCRAAGGLP
jgi:transposase, IS5 family